MKRRPNMELGKPQLALRRGQAEQFIDELRRTLAHRGHIVDMLRAQGALPRAAADSANAAVVATIEAKLAQLAIPPLTPCDGEAHRTDSGAPYVDNCARCMPRWAYVGPRVRVT